MGISTMAKVALLALLLLAVAWGTPLRGSAPSDVVTLNEESALDGLEPIRIEYHRTLQMMADKYCTEYRRPLGKGPIFCSMMAALQEKWADAEALGDTKAYMKYLGAITGHWCGTAYRKETY